MHILGTKLEGWLWSSAPQGGWRRGLFWGGRLLLALWRDAAKGEINLRAMSLVYTTLLSLVPFLALSFSVLKAFGVHNQLEPFLLNLLLPLGEKGPQITAQILQFVSNMKVGVLGAIGLAILIYTVLMLMHKIQHALDFTWEIDTTPGFGKRFADYLVLLLIGPVLLFALASLVAGVLESAMMQHLMQTGVVARVITWLADWTPLLMMLGAMAFLYWFLPNTIVRWYAALVGGSVAALLWKSIGWMFATFIAGSGQYMAVYSAFASVLLFMIWLYLIWLILLLGSRIAFYIQHPLQMGPGRGEITQSPADYESAGLQLLCAIFDRFSAGQAPYDEAALGKMLDISPLRVQSLLAQFEAAGWLARSASHEGGWLPAVAAESILLADLLKSLRAAPVSSRDKAVQALMHVIERSLADALEGRSLADLLDRNLAI